MRPALLQGKCPSGNYLLSQPAVRHLLLQEAITHLREGGEGYMSRVYRLYYECLLEHFHEDRERTGPIIGVLRGPCRKHIKSAVRQGIASFLEEKLSCSAGEQDLSDQLSNMSISLSTIPLGNFPDNPSVAAFWNAIDRNQFRLKEEFKAPLFSAGADSLSCKWPSARISVYVPACNEIKLRQAIPLEISSCIDIIIREASPPIYCGVVRPGCEANSLDFMPRHAWSGTC